MSITINLPGGVVITADTLVEAVAVAKALAPGAIETVLPEAHEPAAKRTRLLTSNADIALLDAWGLGDESIRQEMTSQDWEELARLLRRTVTGTQSVVRRYAWGVYESSGSDPAAPALVHREKDLSRPKSEA